MLTHKQVERIAREAYLPEHLPDYVCSVSGAEPLWFGDYLAYARGSVLIFIGYPLGAPFDPQSLEESLAKAVGQCRPGLVSLIAPAMPPSLGRIEPSDHYYSLDLAAVVRSSKTRNMLRRAGRELTLETGRTFLPEHGRLVEDFLRRRPLDEATGAIFAALGRYVETSPGTRIFTVKNSAGATVAFDVAEFGPRDWAFYMFNVTAAESYVPGASDLLLERVIAEAAATGKRFLNLGLGINPGVTAFKEKWGGAPFVPHVFHQYRPPAKGLLEMVLRWL